MQSNQRLNSDGIGVSGYVLSGLCFTWKVLCCWQLDRLSVSVCLYEGLSKFESVKRLSLGWDHFVVEGRAPLLIKLWWCVGYFGVVLPKGWAGLGRNGPWTEWFLDGMVRDWNVLEWFSVGMVLKANPWYDETMFMGLNGLERFLEQFLERFLEKFLER